MTKRKSILAYLFAICLIVPIMLMFSACGEEKHKHTFSPDWTPNETHHWHAATCEHTDEKGDYAEHDFGAWTEKTPASLHQNKIEERKCKVCEFTETRPVEDSALHDFSSTWEKDATNHWHECACGAKKDITTHEFGSWSVKTPEALHQNRIEKRTCEVCGYEETNEILNTALHTYSGWKSDSNKHWKESTCEGHSPALIIEESAHQYDNDADAECNVCGYTRAVSSNDVVVTGDFEKGTNLSANKIESTDSSYATIIETINSKNYVRDKVAVFDISLNNQDGLKIQPNGNVKITMPKPFESASGYIAFHIKADNSVETLAITTTDANISFETRSFSYFIIAGMISTSTVSITNTHADSLEHAYNGAAVFVSKEDIFIDGTALSEITDENILNDISYYWRDKNTQEVVTPDLDITMLGESYTYGVNRDMTVGDEFAGPCVVGEYEFVFSYAGVQKIVDARITENTFNKITSVENFDATTAPTIFGEICYYTIVGFANGQMYVMQMPEANIGKDDITSIDAQARLVTANADGSIILGGQYDFVFTPMRYYENEWKYYPEESRDREDLLVDFCTGYYGARTATIGLATQVINRIGWTRLSGDKIVREKGEYVGINYGNLTKFASDGAVTIYAPRKGETENNALRLVKDGDKYVFTGKDKTTDTRESFPIYVYKNYVEEEQSGTYEFYSKLDKEYDGTAVQFNAYKDAYIETENGEDLGALIKMDAIKFVFKDLKDNIIMTGTIQDDGTVLGPTEVGQYKLVVQLAEKGEKGLEWVDKATLCEFEIYPAS